MQIKIVNRFINDLHKHLSVLFLKHFSVSNTIFYPPESKYGKVFELVLVSGSELSSSEWPRSTGMYVIYPYS